MSPILSLEAEICAALKTASAPRSLDLLAEIRAGVKLAGEAAPVTPASPAAPVVKPPAAGAPAAGAPAAGAPAAPVAPGNPFSDAAARLGNALKPAVDRPAPPGPQAGKPTTPAPAAPAAQPAAPPEPKPGATGSRPTAPQGALSAGWDALKNNWDVAAIPLSLLAMMFGGKTGKMLGALGMAAGGYGLYNRYQGMKNYGEAAKPIAGETPEQFKARETEQFAKNLQGGYRAAEARRQADAKFKPLVDSSQQALDAAIAKVPGGAQTLPAVMEARTSMLDAQQAYNELLQKDPQSPDLAAAKQAVDEATQRFGTLGGGEPALKPVFDAQAKLDQVKWQHERAMKPWAEWEKANPQLGSSFKAVNAMAPGVMLSQIQSANPELKGATERTVQDLMYRLGHGDKPADYNQTPMTPQENQADRALAWLLRDPKAVEAMKNGGPGTLDQLLIGWNDRGAGKRWD